MIPRDCARLAEVDFPIAKVSQHSAREKSIRHGHPSTLHLWWARRPLAACRSMLLALLLPDPCDEHCPKEFKTKARELLEKAPGCRAEKGDAELRAALLRFIGDFADWDHSAQSTYLEVGRGLVKAAHPETPLVVDPFSGGGSIPLEALRLGCEAFASDLNPVACLILKVMLEDIPRHGPDLADELRRVGSEIKKQAEKELAEFYPKGPDGATPIAYLWARTVRCESPNCGAEIPLVRSLWLCKKAGRRKALRYKVIRPKGKAPHVEFEVFGPAKESSVEAGFAEGGKAKCPACGSVLDSPRVRAQLAAERGGASPRFDAAGARAGGAMMTAVVTTSSNSFGRSYRTATATDYRPCLVVSKRPEPNSPSEEINPVRPSPNARGLSAVTRYGMGTFSDLYSRRQREALCAFAREVSGRNKTNGVEMLALAVGRAANAWTSLCRWHQTGEKVEGAFNGQKIPMVWDFAEVVPFSSSTGGWDGAVEWVATVAEKAGAFRNVGQVQQADAAIAILPEASASVWFTDPPYYDAVPYADLSDFFLVWLKRSLPEFRLVDPYLLGNPLSPKAQECVWNQSHCDSAGQPKTASFFEVKFSEAAATGKKTLSDEGVACVVFAHKSTDGWEALLNGLIGGGFVITASWPIATEMAQRTNARGTASLMGSVHLICRPRPNDAPVGDWGEVLRELPKRVGDWMERLQNEGVRGADLVFACIGPALEIFSRYRKVETADGKEVKLADYLTKVWEIVGRLALEQILGTAEAKARNGAAGALEEDARLTALFLWTLQATDVGAATEDTAEDEEDGDDGDEEDVPKKKKTKGFSLIYDVARRFAQPLGIHLENWEGRVIETDKGVVRLLAVSERATQLFGEASAQAIAARMEQSAERDPQQWLLPEMAPQAQAPKVKGRRSSKKEPKATPAEPEAQRPPTTLDRIHAAMLLQAGGQTNGLRALLKAEQERGPEFLRLANALSALYPKDCDEKRLLDAMLLAMPK